MSQRRLQKAPRIKREDGDDILSEILQKAPRIKRKDGDDILSEVTHLYKHSTSYLCPFDFTFPLMLPSR